MKRKFASKKRAVDKAVDEKSKKIMAKTGMDPRGVLNFGSKHETGQGDGGRTGQGGRGGGGASRGGLDYFSSNRGINLSPEIGEEITEELLQSTEEAKMKGDEGIC